MQLLSRILILTTLFTLGCSAQSAQSISSADVPLERKVELQLRSFFDIPPNVNIAMGKRTPSDLPGYDKLDVVLSLGEKTETKQFLISKDNSALVRWDKMDLNANPMNSIDVSGRPWRGNKDAKVVIVNYDDFQCPFCSRMHQVLFPGILKQYGDQVKIIYKDFPLVGLHPWAMHAAIDANCLSAQNNDAYWDFADYAHNNQKELSGQQSDLNAAFSRLDKLTQDIGKKRNLDEGKLAACLKQQSETAVHASMLEGDKLGVVATPTLFINGEKVPGAFPEDQLRIVINRALLAAGGKLPPEPQHPTAP